MVSEPSGEEFADIFDYTSGSWLACTLVLNRQEYVLLPSGDPGLAEQGLPETLSAEFAGARLAWLELNGDGVLEVCEHESGIGLYACAVDTERECYLILQDELCLAAVPS